MSYGTLAPDRGNVIVYPTSFSAQHHDTGWLVRPVGILDPSRCFIIVPNLFGNGPSCSPSNTPWPLTDNRFPDVTCHDAVRVQQRLPAEVFGIQRVKRVYGWSMGGMQAYHWAVARPELVERIAVVCGSFRCAPHNAVFIEGVRAALQADPTFIDGAFTGRSVREHGKLKHPPQSRQATCNPDSTPLTEVAPLPERSHQAPRVRARPRSSARGACRCRRPV